MYSQFILHFYFGLKLKGTIDGVNIQLTKADKEEIPDDTKLTYTIKQYTDDIKKPLFSGDNVIKAVTIAKIIGFATRSMSDIIQVITKDHIDKFRRKEHLEFYCISALNQILCYLVQDESIFYLFLTFLSHIASDEFFKKDYFSEMIYPAKYSLYTLVPRSHVLYEQIREVKDYFKINDDILNCGVFFNFREASSEGDNLTSSKIYKILDLQSIHEYTYFINTLVRMIFKKPKIMSLVPSIRHKPLYEKINDDEPLYSVYTNEVTSYSCKDLRVINSDKWKETKLAVATGEEVREEDVAVAVPLGETLSICNRWVAETREQQFRTLSNPRVTDSTTELCAILSRLVYCDTSVIQEFFKDDSNIKYLMPLDPDPEWLGNYPNVIKHRIHVFYKKENPSTETPISVFIVFRGSLTSRDWFETNVDITLASKRGASFNHRIINFPVFIKRITDNIKRIIIKKMNLRYASVKFYSTGHSLGGYLALMLSSYSYSLIISNEAPDAFVSTRLNSTRSKIKYYKAIEPIVFNPFGGTLNRPGKALVTIYYPDSHFYRDAFTSYLEIIRSGQVHRIRSGPRGRNSFYDIASSPIAASIYNTSLQLIEYQNIYDSNNKKELTTIDGLTLDDNFNYAQSHAMYQFIGLVSFYIDSLTLKGNSERIYSSDPIQDIISIKPFKEDITLSTNINLVLLELNDKYKFLSNTFWANLRRMVNPGPLSPSSPYSQVYAQGGRIRTRSLRSTRKSKLLHSPYSVSRKRRVSSL
jgi:hypothetical protein